MAITYKRFPSVVSGYVLSPKYGWVSILQPGEATNLVTNPSFELGEVNPGGITRYNETDGVNSTISVTVDEQRRGAWSAKITPNAGDFDNIGILYSIENDTTDVFYTISFDFKGNAGHRYRVFGYRTDNSVVGAYEVVSSGRWQRLSITLLKEPFPPSLVSVRVVRVSPTNDTTPFYFDGFMMIEGTEESTYFDGDTQSYNPKSTGYYWVGTSHLSISQRNANEMSTGFIKDISEYDFDILGISGLELIPQDQTLIGNAMIGGANFQRGVDVVREYNITGAMAKVSMSDLMKNKAEILSLVRNSHTYQQEATIAIQLVDDCGKAYTEPLLLPSLYDGGLEGSISNLHQERMTMQFSMPKPQLLVDGEEGISLNTHQSLSSLGNLARRTPGFGWDTWASANGSISKLHFDEKNGYVYTVGDFTTIDGSALERFAYYDVEEDAWAEYPSVSSGANAAVYDIDILPNGDPWICGAFTSVNGSAVSYNAIWLSASSVWGTSVVLPGTAVGMKIASNGIDTYFVGSDGGGGYVYHWDGSSTTDLTPVRATTDCRTVAIDKDGSVYVGGRFTAINGVSANSIAKWDGSTWTALGDGLEPGVTFADSMVFGDDGNLYISGVFSTADGVSASKIVSWNGTSFSALGGGIDNLASGGHRLQWHEGNLYVGMNGAGCSCALDQTTAIYIAKWNGTNWSHLDFTPDFPVGSVAFDNGGVLYASGSFTTSSVSNYQTVTNTGTANAEPVIVIKGELVAPGAHTWDDKILWIKNETTEQTILLDMTIAEYEKITFDFRKGKKSIISDVRGDLSNGILPSSDFANFYLAPGENSITISIEDAALVSHIYWQIPHDYLSGAIYN